MKSLAELDLLFESLKSTDDKIRYPAFLELQKITEEKVDWVYDKWHQLIEKLSSENSYQRTIGFTLLANLCKSDTDQRMNEMLSTMLNFTDDEKFITARLALQNVWKIAISNESTKMKVVRHLENAWIENIHLKTHPNLIKHDIILSLRNIYKNTGDKEIEGTITQLIDSETDEAFIKKLQKLKS